MIEMHLEFNLWVIVEDVSTTTKNTESTSNRLIGWLFCFTAYQSFSGNLTSNKVMLIKVLQKKNPEKQTA